MPAGFPPFSTLFHRLIHILVNCDSLFPERFPVACQNLRLKTCTTLLHIFHEKVYYNKNPSLNEGFLLSNFSILSVLCNDSSGLSYRNINRKSGVLRGIRTPDLLVRSQTLYPAELRPHNNKSFYNDSYYNSDISQCQYIFVYFTNFDLIFICPVDWTGQFVVIWTFQYIHSDAIICLYKI